MCNAMKEWNLSIFNIVDKCITVDSENVHENLIFANIRKFLASRIQSSH